MGLSEKLVEIKSETDALITYANGVTGEADTRLGDAIQTLAEGFGQGGSSMWELIGEHTCQLDEYTDTSTNSFVNTGIDIRNTDYAFVFVYVHCDGTPEGTNDWGGTSCIILTRYKTNLNAMTTTVAQTKGANSLQVSELPTNCMSTNSYGVYFSNNTSEIVYARKCHYSACPKIMSGNYTVKAYGLASLS